MINMRVRRGHTGRYRGSYNVAGGVMPMEDDEAVEAAASGQWEPADEDDATALAVAQGVDTEETPSPQKPDGEALTEAIMGAIAKLDTEEDFGRDGKPAVKALSQVLGYKVTGAERDAVWETVKDSGPPAPNGARGDDEPHGGEGDGEPGDGAGGGGDGPTSDGGAEGDATGSGDSEQPAAGDGQPSLGV